LSLITAAQDKIAAANKIIISGAGSTGVETAAEIMSQFPEKNVRIITSGANVVPMFIPSVQQQVERTLKKLGVEIVRNAKLVEATPLPNRKRGVEVHLSTGETLVADVHIPTTGGTPNTDFLPDFLLNEEGWLVVDSCFRSPKAPNTWGVGDVTQHWQRKQTVADSVVGPFSDNVIAVLHGKQPKPHVYKTDIGTFMVLGPKMPNGAGFFYGGWRVPGFVVWLAKGINYLTCLAPGIVGKP
jgi:NADH dehydrogenase FAD-containing subunit